MKGEFGSKANVVGVLAARALQSYLGHNNISHHNHDNRGGGEANWEERIVF